MVALQSRPSDAVLLQQLVRFVIDSIQSGDSETGEDAFDVVECQGSSPNPLGRVLMARSDLEEFASLLVRHVRDAAIRSCDMNLSPDASSIVSRRWQRAASRGTSELMSEAIADCVDETLFFLLTAIDNGLLPLRLATVAGETVDLAESGELAGLYILNDGWRASHSSERSFDFSGD